jgi:hypothetical protein
MESMFFTRLCFCLFVFISHNAIADSPSVFRANFDNLNGWKNDSAAGSPKSYRLENGSLLMSTRVDSKDRVKLATTRRFGLGKYEWRVYVPKLGVGDQASVGAFLYRDDKHEVDFEIGYGKQKLRNKLKAQADDLVCYSTSQGHPYSSSQFLLKREQWYVFALELKKGSIGKYTIVWSIDNKVVKTLPTKIDSKVDFTVHCSVENLTFMGEHLPKVKPWAKFDYFQFTPGK